MTFVLDVHSRTCAVFSLHNLCCVMMAQLHMLLHQLVHAAVMRFCKQLLSTQASFSHACMMCPAL